MTVEQGLTYQEAGVNIRLGDDASTLAFKTSVQSWKNRVGRPDEMQMLYKDFSGIRYLRLTELPPGTIPLICTDGIGTKIEIAERLNDHSTIADNLFAMVGDDIVAKGGEFVQIVTVLSVNQLEGNEKELHQLFRGYGKAADKSGTTIGNGEIAELGDMIGGYGKFRYDWTATAFGLANENRLITGLNIQPGDKLVAFKENGFRSNGFTLIRKILERSFGSDWHKHEDFGIKNAKGILKPSIIYSKAVANMTGGYEFEPKVEIHGVAHITGGGIPGKLGRVLKPTGYGAFLEAPYAPPPIMRYLQSLGSVEDQEAYNAWNMGQGMILVTPDPERIIQIAKEFRIDAKLVGEIREKPGIKIRSKGIYKEGKILSFE